MRAAVAAVEFEELHQPVEVLVGVGGVLEIGQPLDAGEQNIVQRPRKFADARQQTVKLRMACECRAMRRSAWRPLGRDGDGCARGTRRFRGLRMRRAESVEAWCDALAAGA